MNKPIYKLKSTYFFILVLICVGLLLRYRYIQHSVKKKSLETVNFKIESEKKLEELLPSSYISNKKLENVPNPFVTEWLDRPKDMMSANVISHMLKSNNVI